MDELIGNVGLGRSVLTKWVNWQAILIVAALAIGAMAVMSARGLREIHNASQPFNFALVEPRPTMDDWPAWRGIDGRNVATIDTFPLKWDPSHHEGWKTAIPGIGNATPIIWGHQVLVPSHEISSRRILLNCIHRKTGRMLWKTVLHQSSGVFGREAAGQGGATPACDGQNVFTVIPWQNRLWITATDLAGQVVWQRDVGAYASITSYSSSPVLFKSLVIASADQASGSFLVALHRQTGEIIWKVRRPNGVSFGSPVLVTSAGSSQLIVAGTGSIKSYDPATGNEIWTCRTSTEQVANSIAYDQGRIFVTRARPRPEVLCINAGGTGDITTTHIEWRLSQFGSETVSPVLHNGLLYVLSDDGQLGCIHATTGKVEWSKQLPGSFSASPVIAGDYLFCANDAGSTFFVSLGSGLQIIENSLSDGLVASPVFAGDSIFIRSANRIHRITSSDMAPIVEKPSDARRRF